MLITKVLLRGSLKVLHSTTGNPRARCCGSTENARSPFLCVFPLLTDINSYSGIWKECLKARNFPNSSWPVLLTVHQFIDYQGY